MWKLNPSRSDRKWVIHGSAMYHGCAEGRLGYGRWGTRWGDGSPGWKGAKWVGIRWLYGKSHSVADGQYLQVLCVVWVVAIYFLRRGIHLQHPLNERDDIAVGYRKR